MKRYVSGLILAFLVLSSTGCLGWLRDDPRVVVRTETVYEKPTDRWLEDHPRPVLVGETNRALWAYVQALHLALELHEADKAALREWADGLPDEPVVTEEREE